MTKQEWFEAHGFDENGQTLCVFGDDTYSIKEHLKEIGCRFDPVFKWHSPVPLDIPVGYGMFGVQYSDYMKWDEKHNCMEYFTDAKDKMDRKFKEVEPNIPSEFYPAEERTRIYNITAIFQSMKTFFNDYGQSFIYTFTAEDYVFVWFTQKELNLEPNTIVDFTGTIKKFEEFRGINTTVVSRCIIKEVGVCQ